MAPPLGSWFERLPGRPKRNQLDMVCQRFLDVFRLHGVEASQIPRLLPSVKLADLQSTETLLGTLTPELLDQVAALFGVRVTWLEGVDDEVYDYLGTYKEPIRILRHISTVLTDESSKWEHPVRVLCTKKCLDRHSDDNQKLAPVVIEQITLLGEDPIFRYHVYRDGFPWDHAPARIELKALARTIFTRLGVTVPLYEISAAEMEELLDGRRIPGFLRTACLNSNPSLEDYALSRAESGVAKETDEFPDVLAYIEKTALKDFSFSPRTHEQDEQEPKRESGSPTKPGRKPQTGKRAQAEIEIWGPLQIAAKTIWAQEPGVSIADVVRRLRAMPQFKKAGGESAFRKRLAGLAPEGVAGKPGRKANKLT